MISININIFTILPITVQLQAGGEREDSRSGAVGSVASPSARGLSAPYLAAGRCSPQCSRRAAAALEVQLFSPGSCT